MMEDDGHDGESAAAMMEDDEHGGESTAVLMEDDGHDGELAAASAVSQLMLSLVQRMIRRTLVQ